MAGNIRYCKMCGAQVKAGAKFCKKCGYKFEATAAVQEAVKQATPSAAPVAAPAPVKQTPPVVSATKAPADVRREGITASAAPGEFALMDLASDMIPGAAKVKEVATTFSAIGGGLKSFLAGIPGIFKSPVTVIATVVLAGLWIWLGMNRGSDSTLVKALSFLTFSEGGFNRDEIGAVGGIAGKGVVGVVLTSLFSGGIKKFSNGLAAMFKKTDTKRSAISLIIGAIIGMVLYCIFTGTSNATWATAMAGVSGAILSLQALGSKNGILYGIAESFTSKKINGVRTAQDGQINSLFSGITVGFALTTALAPMIL